MIIFQIVELVDVAYALSLVEKLQHVEGFHDVHAFLSDIDNKWRVQFQYFGTRADLISVYRELDIPKELRTSLFTPLVS